MKRLNVTPTTTAGDLEDQIKEVEQYKEDLALSIEKRIEDLKKEIRNSIPERLDLVDNVEEQFETAKDALSTPYNLIGELYKTLEGVGKDLGLSVNIHNLPTDRYGKTKANILGFVTVINNILNNMENIRDSVKDIRNSYPYLIDKENLEEG